MPKLKVFRTPIGFHDAYVAAPSQKAALQAWGTDANLFARGIADVVTNPELTRAPLENPGKVVRVLREMEEEDEPEASRKKSVKARKSPSSRAMLQKASADSARPETPAPRKECKPKPQPSRAVLDRADVALAQEDSAYAAADRDLKEKEQAIKDERQRLRRVHEQEMNALADKRDKAKADYCRRIEEWAGE